jgi:KaiC/GvpD/RAD55 family RecA-like ATPase
MNQDKQKLMLTYLLSSNELFIKANPVLEAAFFDLELKKAVDFIKKHYASYKAIPTKDQLFVETGVMVEPKDLSRQELKYAETELESYCQYKAAEAAIFAAVTLIQEDRRGEIVKLIRDACAVCFQRSIGTDYFADPEARLNMLATQSASIPTKIKKLDEALGGGLNRKEMIIFAAPSGVGKSITMSNVARNLVDQGYYGIYISLELSEEMVAKRFDSMTTGLAQGEILKNISKVVHEVKKTAHKPGQFVIKRMPESVTNANDIRAYIKEYEAEYNRLPDFVVVDYIDIMASNDKVSAENTFVKDKYVTEELRSIANEMNLMMISASQLNRGAQTLESLDDLNQSHIAGGISKINTTDNLVAIIQTAQQKAQGVLIFKMLKTRSSSGVGSYFTVKFNSYNLRITDLVDDDDDKPKSMADRISSWRGKKDSSGNEPSVAPEQPMNKPTPKPSFTGVADLFQV